MIPPRIILASRSKNRQELLSSLGIRFSALPSEIDEDAIVADDPEERAKRIARAKARDVGRKNSGFIIAADSFSVYNGKEYQKPVSHEDARRMLKELSGKQGRVVTGICVIDTRRGREVSETNVVHLRCKTLSEEEIDQYVSNRPVTEWAAAYNPLDDMSASIFTPIGSYPYRIEYYGIGIETLAREFRRIHVAYDLSAALSHERPYGHNKERYGR